MKNGIELISSIERIVSRFEKKSGAIGSESREDEDQEGLQMEEQKATVKQ